MAHELVRQRRRQGAQSRASWSSSWAWTAGGEQEEAGPRTANCPCRGGRSAGPGAPTDARPRASKGCREPSKAVKGGSEGSEGSEGNAIREPRVDTWRGLVNKTGPRLKPPRAAVASSSAHNGHDVRASSTLRSLTNQRSTNWLVNGLNWANYLSTRPRPVTSPPVNAIGPPLSALRPPPPSRPGLGGPPCRVHAACVALASDMLRSVSNVSRWLSHWLV